jgi:hypothetical protein
MGTMFGLRVVEFPPILHLNYVLKFMFVVSIAVIVPLIGLVVYTTRRAIGKVIWRIEQSLMNERWFHKLRWERKKKLFKRKWEEREGVSSMVGMNEKGVGRTRFGFLRRKSVIPVVDAEKGPTVDGVEEIE